MRIATTLALVIVAVAMVGAVNASAQSTPFIAVYFDNYYTQQQTVCKGLGVADTFYVVARNFPYYLTGAEYQVEYPAGMNFVSDMSTGTVTIGQSPTGISIGFGNPPRNGFLPVLIEKVRVTWVCLNCSGIEEGEVRVVPHQATGKLGVTKYPDFAYVPGIGLTSLVCSSVPVEETTWGKVKALYNN